MNFCIHGEVRLEQALWLLSVNRILNRIGLEGRNGCETLKQVAKESDAAGEESECTWGKISREKNSF